MLHNMFSLIIQDSGSGGVINTDPLTETGMATLTKCLENKYSWILHHISPYGNIITLTFKHLLPSCEMQTQQAFCIMYHITQC